MTSDFRKSMAFAIHEYITRQYIPQLEGRFPERADIPPRKQAVTTHKVTSHTSIRFDRVTRPIGFEFLFKEPSSLAYIEAIPMSCQS